MDELLQDFLAETGEHLEAAGAHLVRFERNPSDAQDIASIFRLVHTIKGTCGFIGLPRLERLAHNAESLVAPLRDGIPSTQDTVSLVLATVDRIRFILRELADHAAEPSGNDEDLIAEIVAVTGEPPGPEPDLEDEAEPRAETAPIPPPLAASAPSAVAASAPSGSASAAPGRAALPSGPPAAGEAAVMSPASTTRRHESVRVAVSLLETLMTLVSELVLTRNQLTETTRRADEPGTKVAMGRLSNLLSDLQDAVMRSRMQPLDRLFGTFARFGREIGRELDKPVDMILSGADTELDRQLVEIIRDPLTHLIRNCADHGLEAPAERRAAGKPATGVIRISASHESGTVVIRVADDGRGLDIGKIRRKALALELATPFDLDRLSDADICRFIFSPGFSTADAVTTVSGRGMGMDIVRRNIESIGGSIELSTTAGRGTSFALKIPLTLAIIPALIVELGRERFAVPQNAVTEVVELSEWGAARLEHIGGALLLRLRQEIVPVCDLGRMLGLRAEGESPRSQFVVLMRVGRFRFGAIVDCVAETQEIVVKPLMPALGPLEFFSGNTILGDGSVVLILDGAGIARRLDPRQTEDGNVAAVAPDISVFEVEPTPLILFRAGPGPIKALPITLITRIEMIDALSITSIDNGLVTVHGGRMMPLVPAGEVPASGSWPVLVVGVSGELMGIVATEIIDIVAVPLTIEICSRSPGLVGSTEIAGHAVEVLDITHFMRLGRPEAFARGRNRRGRVLLVEDKRFFRDMLAPALIAAGYDVAIASGAVGALATLRRSEPFDAVATDIEMPGMSGYALARALKADPQFASLPVVGLAAVIAPAVRAAAEAAGMARVITKLDRVALVDAMAAVLGIDDSQSFALEERILAGEAA